jgi:hypothetical protein
MRRPRFSVRRMMVAVLIAGLGAWAYTLWLRYGEFAARAYEHRKRTYGHEELMGIVRQSDEIIEFHEEWIRYEDKLYRKYRFAAFFPWLPVAPDPPARSDPLCDDTIRQWVASGRPVPWNWFTY